jgi:hypothetical protein
VLPALLFASAGMASLRSDSISVACLLLALMPRYPSSSVDNQYHLQAWRHLSALAIENRFLQTVDVDSGKNVSVPVFICIKGSDERIRAVSPCLLPELHTIREISLVEADVSGDDGAGNYADQYCANGIVVAESAYLVSVPIMFVSKRRQNAGTVCFNHALVQSSLDSQQDEIAKSVQSTSLFAAVRLQALKSMVY